MHVCFHHAERAKHGAVLGNVRFLLADESVDLDAVAVVANGPGVELALADGDFHEDVNELLEQGVAFKICGNTLRGSNLDRNDLVDGVEVVSSGVGELTRLQEAGFGYIRP